MEVTDKPHGWIVQSTILKSEKPMLILATEPDAELIVRGFSEHRHKELPAYTVRAFRFMDADSAVVLQRDRKTGVWRQLPPATDQEECP